MKSKSFISLAAAAMLLSLAACSKDASEPVVTPDGPDAYAKVNLVMGGVSSRATSGGYDDGEADEAKVNSVMLVLYDNAGGVVGYGATEPKDGTTVGTTKDNVTSKYTSQIVHLTMSGAKDLVKKVVAYVNVDNEILDLAAAQLQTSSDVYTEVTEGTDKVKKFYMTNSGYYDGSNWVAATDIEEGSIYSTIEAASASDAAATTIYVERLAAKVQVKLNGTLKTDANFKIFGVDGETEYTLTFDAANAKWAPTGTAPEMYMLKKQFTKSEGMDWSVPTVTTDCRSYWAKGLYYGETESYADYKNILSYVNSNALRRTNAEAGEILGKAMAGVAYTTEHTYGSTVVNDPDYNALGAATSAIVLGQYKVSGGDAETKFKVANSEAYDFYLLLKSAGEKYNYTIFTEKELMDYLFDNTKTTGLFADNEGKTAVTKENYDQYLALAFVDAKYTFKAENPLYVLNDGNYVEFTAYATSNARHYNLGYAYFFAPIEHLGAAGAEGQYGVVRNHSYVLTINEINSLGAPLDDDHFGKDPDKTPDPDDPDPDPEDPGEEPIIPDPTKDAYINATLEVLSWHVVNQGVIL